MQTPSQSPAETDLSRAKLTWLGHSNDHRTNRWRVECPKCTRAWEPPTTMFGSMEMVCPKSTCRHEFMAFYNQEIDRINARDRADARGAKQQAATAA